MNLGWLTQNQSAIGRNDIDAQQIRAGLTDIFRRVFNNPSLQLNDTLTARDVEGWDSLNHVALISEIERQFGIKFKLKELLNIENVGDLLRLIATKTGSVA